MRYMISIFTGGILLALLGMAIFFQVNAAASELEGTAWKLVRFEGGDDTVLVPEEGVSYELKFRAEGKVTARINCNNGSGTWSSEGPNRIKFGPMAVTMMACPKGQNLERFGRDLANITSYVIRDGNLYLALMADGGIYEFAPLISGQNISGKITYRERIAVASGVVTVKLTERKATGSATTTIAEHSYETGGKQIPFEYALAFDPAKVNPGARYTLIATITVNGRVWFRGSKQVNLSGRQPVAADMVLRRIIR
ncbi:YbaY family lipoprotein [Leptolyngbya sp. 7M]|uniref:YbaY family lipoprotein n=1 Tax=Leptolyngbya sp. 7M TaxID=2812896 RepID=UPI001B8B6503|nr:YbaY family lipoprotein [Leptolyngbya sp. 7M]QYO66001.1 YbaY family lipoprotein [Leptolyngbya sp. 7M]